MRPLHESLEAVTSWASYGRAFSQVIFLKEFRMKDYSERPEDVINAVRSLRRSGMDVGMPCQTPEGTMIFQLDGYTLSVAQILELLDRNRLDRDGIRALAEAQKK